MATLGSRQRAGMPEDEAADESISLKGTFVKDLSTMMYAFGDHDTPLPETVDLVEEIVIEYASGVFRKSLNLASLRGKSKPPLKGVGAVTAEDIMAIVKKDPKKFERVKELFELQKELKEARATFEIPDGLDTEALASLSKDVEDQTAVAPSEGQI
ncbi:hypothetical protein Ndes2526B_g01427 [Nannochloris sp. 'desiccata']|nr:hypothetical protein KSW81_004252 [Chlorella desiccata (nom. nud.)]KAH7624169.1 putative Transcription initiation factor TFIID subunit 13 [Chlorella desiccata (nom. nud.)]